MKRPSVLLCTGLLLLGASAALAQGSSLADRVVACTGIVDDAERLSCFDEVAGPLVNLVEDDSDERVFVGEGHWDSDQFPVERPFRLAWQSEATSLTIEVRGAGGDLLALIGPQIGEGAGRSELFRPGDYLLGIRASDGAWRVQVVEE